MTHKIHTNATHAIHEGQQNAPCGIAYVHDKGWQVYDLRRGVDTSTATPEFICVGLGVLPQPLTADATDVLMSVLRAHL